jgi:hypothetical protein
MNAEAGESARAALRRPEPGRFRGQHLKEKAQMREITTGATAALVAALLGTSPAEANDRGLKGTTVNPFSCYVPDLVARCREMIPSGMGAVGAGAHQASTAAERCRSREPSPRQVTRGHLSRLVRPQAGRQ